MRVNLEDYYILSTIFLANNLVITFQYSLDIHSRRVLECKEVAGFKDQRNGDDIVNLRINERGGSYPLDLALHLQRPEISEYPEAFFFLDDKEVNFSFRVCVRDIHFRDWSEKVDAAFK